MGTYRQLRDELGETALGLVAEFGEVPAGVVLRHFARAVRFSRLVATDSDELPQQAANITRIALGGRVMPVDEALPWGA